MPQRYATDEEIYTGLLSLVKSLDPSVVMQVRGVPTDSIADLDEWISFDILAFIDMPSRRNVIDRVIDIQTTCYTRHAVHRGDKKFGAHYALATKYGALFHKKDILIKNTCIQFKENRIVPLDLRSTGFFASNTSNPTPLLNTQAIVILNQGVISSNIEE
jgi:hypothetical protein